MTEANAKDSPELIAPFLSVIMASYNHAAYIGGAIESLQAQTDGDWELVVVDDGSKDDSVAIARSYEEKDPRVKVYAQENKGVTEARNRAVSLCTGVYLSQLDSDDFYPPDRVARIREASILHPDSVLFYGDAWLTDDSGSPRNRFFELYPPSESPSFSAALWSTHCFTHAQSVTVRRATLLETGPFWGPPHNIDYLKWIEVGLRGKVVQIPGAPLSYHRIHGKNASTPNAEKRIRQYRETAEGLRELLKRHPEFGGSIPVGSQNRRLAQCAFMGGFHALRFGMRAEAAVEFGKAFREYPTVVHLLAMVGALPVAAWFSQPLARWVAQKKLGIYQ